jgi:hypothetical protein
MKAESQKRKPKAKRFEGTISFGVSEAMEGQIYAFLDANPMLENTAAAVRHLVRRGLEAEKEAAHG